MSDERNTYAPWELSNDDSTDNVKLYKKLSKIYAHNIFNYTPERKLIPFPYSTIAPFDTLIGKNIANISNERINGKSFIYIETTDHNHYILTYKNEVLASRAEFEMDIDNIPGSEFDKLPVRPITKLTWERQTNTTEDVINRIHVVRSYLKIEINNAVTIHIRSSTSVTVYNNGLHQPVLFYIGNDHNIDSASEWYNVAFSRLLKASYNHIVECKNERINACDIEDLNCSPGVSISEMYGAAVGSNFITFVKTNGAVFVLCYRPGDYETSEIVSVSDNFEKLCSRKFGITNIKLKSVYCGRKEYPLTDRTHYLHTVHIEVLNEDGEKGEVQITFNVGTIGSYENYLDLYYVGNLNNTDYVSDSRATDMNDIKHKPETELTTTDTKPTTIVESVKDVNMNICNEDVSYITLIGSGKFMKKFFDVRDMIESVSANTTVFIPRIFSIPNPSALSEMDHYVLDTIHCNKILMSKCVFVIDPGGYVGDDTKKEIEFAKEHKIPVYYYSDMEKLVK